jgi:microcompartment protein CcmL/EutN
VHGYHVIPRPHDETEQVIGLVDRGPAAAPELPASPPPSVEERAPAPKAPKPAPPKRVAKAPAPATEAPPAQSAAGEAETPAEPAA